MTDSINLSQKLLEPDQSFGAVVLAGGLARRMGGQDKGLVMLSGKPMVHYALRTILPVVDNCVINANRNHQAYERIATAIVSLQRTSLQPAGVSVIPDSLPGHLGPLAGLSAAIDALNTDYVFMCPCDSPFLQVGLVRLLLEQCKHNDADIAVAHDGERLQPVFCVINRRVHNSLNEFLASGQRKIDLWFAEHHLHVVAAEAFSDSFINVNKEEERLEAERRLSS